MNNFCAEFKNVTNNINSINDSNNDEYKHNIIHFNNGFDNICTKSDPKVDSNHSNQINIEQFIKLSTKKHYELKGDKTLAGLKIGKIKKKNTSVNVAGLFRLSGMEWETLIGDSNLLINKDKWLDFSVDNKTKTFLNHSFKNIGCFNLEEAFLRQLFSNSYPDAKKGEKSVLSININGNNVINMYIRHTSYESIKRWITPKGGNDRNKKTNLVTKCCKHSFGSEIEILLTKNIVLKIARNVKKYINDTVTNGDSKKQFANGIGYMWIPGTNTMQCELLFHSDFWRQINMELYVKNGAGIHSINCGITNYNEEYGGHLDVFKWKKPYHNNELNIYRGRQNTSMDTMLPFTPRMPNTFENDNTNTMHNISPHCPFNFNESIHSERYISDNNLNSPPIFYGNDPYKRNQPPLFHVNGNSNTVYNNYTNNYNNYNHNHDNNSYKGIHHGPMHNDGYLSCSPCIQRSIHKNHSYNNTFSHTNHY